ncbi:glycoside hydrolase family 130 protein [Sediminispirochaeta smaragdinae]|uniref:Glycosidase related protein n=1 Tax=Sediminispirochaeta smaragdinae (strain DSM 11293 / JCM 15392 / SEBR 4228) TaxID=573413 RepID=E1R640_SEDSS|nr:glycoside hydrolase family 130 protein [Sediminispirochaeta smaragdinae]ADK80805.1 glycosidase related protein [Sediminispirochaeta smaragdinae DSM 11293]
MNRVEVQRLEFVLRPSHDRVLIRPFIPGDENQRYRIISRVMSLDKEEVHVRLEKVLADFAGRHHNILEELIEHFTMVKQWTITDAPLSEEQRLLIGAYFTQEYSLESAALFNPSIVLHPDQSELPKGAIRFIISLRAIGEGHISSIVFREGMITDDFTLRLRRPAPYVTQPKRIPWQIYDKTLFTRKLAELNCENNFSAGVLSKLEDQFSLAELSDAVERAKRRAPASQEADVTSDGMLTLAYSNYAVSFRPEQRTSEKAIFPLTPSQSNGIEDARFVLFYDDDGGCRYYGTYTAFDGRMILPQLIETEDFISFKFITLNGPAAKNKGMALFPRKINGQYAMISRQDNENLYVMYSDNINFWYDPQLIIHPTFPWEFVQVGNCGSPIELDEGWLVLSHGVGPMRKYCIGAFLLDKKKPTNVIGRLREPLIEPNENEREGYVPNVVYTCGALRYKEKLLIPYAMSDYATGFAFADIKEILDAMV